MERPLIEVAVFGVDIDVLGRQIDRHVVSSSSIRKDRKTRYPV